MSQCYLPRTPSMPRICEASPSASSSAIAKKFHERRPDGLISLEKNLLHNEAIADGCMDMLMAIMTKTAIPGDLRELLILRVGFLNNAEYVWLQHESAARAMGCSLEQLQNIAASQLDDSSFEPRYRAALDYADASTKSVSVPDELFSRCRSFWSESELQEITMTIAAYNMVSRYLVALDVGGLALKPTGLIPSAA